LARRDTTSGTSERSRLSAGLKLQSRPLALFNR
jgi:hypothetical protein